MLRQTPTSVSAVLQELGNDAWTAATQHVMVREIGAGTLPHERFRWYFEQNVPYLEDYVRAIALLIAKAPDFRAVEVLSRFLHQIVDAELPANRRLLECLGGDSSRDAVRAVEPTTYDYTRHLLSVAALGTCAEGLAAVLPCQWSYGELAAPLLASAPEDPIYKQWIAMFANQPYDALVGETTSLLDRLVSPDDEATMRSLTKIFTTSVRYEGAFWDMAYAGPTRGNRVSEEPDV